MRSLRHALRLLIAAILLTCVSCGGGYSSPPPDASAYGYRYRHPSDHVLLIYEPDMAVYTVSGYPSYYFRNGTYYRLRNGAWYHASRIKGQWTAVSYHSIPPGLQKKYKAPPEHAQSHPTQSYKAQKKHIHGHDKN